MASPKSAMDVQNFEYDWLGHDGNGCVALFSTAGYGYPPEDFLRDTDAHHDAIQALLASDATTEAVLFPDLLPKLENTWRLVAERGLYAYDSDQWGRYVLVAVPSLPTGINALPSPVTAVSIRCGFAFVNTRAVTEAMLRAEVRVPPRR